MSTTPSEDGISHMPSPSAPPPPSYTESVALPSYEEATAAVKYAYDPYPKPSLDVPPLDHAPASAPGYVPAPTYVQHPAGNLAGSEAAVARRARNKNKALGCTILVRESHAMPPAMPPANPALCTSRAIP